MGVVLSLCCGYQDINSIYQTPPSPSPSPRHQPRPSLTISSEAAKTIIRTQLGASRKNDAIMFSTFQPRSSHLLLLDPDDVHNTLVVAPIAHAPIVILDSDDDDNNNNNDHYDANAIDNVNIIARHLNDDTTYTPAFGVMHGIFAGSQFAASSVVNFFIDRDCTLWLLTSPSHSMRLNPRMPNESFTIWAVVI